MILLGLIDMLEVQGVFQEKSYIYINKESLERDHIKNYQDLYDAVKEYHYIFVDEIQDIIERERAIRSLYAEKNHDIIITGSNSNLLSTDLSTYLSGRYVQIHIYPLDFKEFLEFHQIKKSKESFFKYMEYGGMPHLLRLGLDQRSMQYLKDIYETIVLKDIVKRYKIRNVSFFEQLIIFIAKNIGSIFSTVNISNALAENNIDILPNVINEYLQYAQRALFLYGIDRYDIKGKKIFERKQKYFLSDVGLRNSLV
jgi:predicted AAA+ superfamily ATPase